MTVNFKTTKDEHRLIEAIADRALQSRAIREAIDRDFGKMGVAMDLAACHANGNQLRFDDLLKADEFDFVHDIVGIYRCLNRETGKLERCFSPRFSRRDPS